MMKPSQITRFKKYEADELGARFLVTGLEGQKVTFVRVADDGHITTGESSLRRFASMVDCEVSEERQ